MPLSGAQTVPAWREDVRNAAWNAVPQQVERGDAASIAAVISCLKVAAGTGKLPAT
jgi:hypothetical protein